VGVVVLPVDGVLLAGVAGLAEEALLAGAALSADVVPVADDAPLPLLVEAAVFVAGAVAAAVLLEETGVVEPAVVADVSPEVTVAGAGAFTEDADDVSPCVAFAADVLPVPSAPPPPPPPHAASNVLKASATASEAKPRVPGRRKA
jgi:hypothetical protein